MKKRLFGGKGLYVLLHFAVWLFLFIVPSLLIYRENERRPGHVPDLGIQVLFSMSSSLFFNYLWLIPKDILSKGKKPFSFAPPCSCHLHDPAHRQRSINGHSPREPRTRRCSSQERDVPMLQDGTGPLFLKPGPPAENPDQPPPF